MKKTDLAVITCRALDSYSHNFYDDLPDDLMRIVEGARRALELQDEDTWSCRGCKCQHPSFVPRFTDYHDWKTGWCLQSARAHSLNACQTVGCDVVLPSFEYGEALRHCDICLAAAESDLEEA